jgi:hypothetical protein
MKIRNGFVSNSSSSSFLIKLGEEFPNTLAIAEHMIKDKYDAWKEWDTDNEYLYSHNKSEASAYNNIKRLKKNGTVNIPFFFHSTNYDTYIVPITDNYVYVDTCNNIQWSIEGGNSVVNNIPDEVEKVYPDAEYNSGELYMKVKRDYEYYLLEKGITAVPHKKYTTCKKCYQEVWYIDDVEYCLYCDAEKIARGFKLNKLKNLIENQK